MKILILGGTGEARELAGRLVEQGHEVVTSLAGRTSAPQLPAGELRVGKFGGVPGLLGYLKARRFDRLVDATHPYAGLISQNAVAAAAQAGIAMVRYVRPAWVEPQGANWTHVPDIAFAAAALPSGASVLVTTGHEGLDDMLVRDDCDLVVRLLEAPDQSLPRHATLVLGHPPYRLADEIKLMQREETTHLVTKNSGGAQTSAKLAAAAQLGVSVVMIDRPVLPRAVETGSLEETLAALHVAGS
jgi:precorrin-6A/cobalt-precorrin-6A reductase